MPTFKEYADNWIKVTVPATCKESTMQDYRAILDNHVLSKLGGQRVDQFTPKIIKTFLLSKINDGFANSTVTHMKDVISGVLNEAVDDEKIQANPVYSLKRLIKKKANDNDVNPLTAKELTKLLKTVQEHYPEHFTIFLLLSRAGMRIGEAIALDWRNIDFKGGSIKVERSIVRGRVSTPKNGKSRPVDISPQLADALKNHMQGFKVSAADDQPRYVFTNRSSNPIDKDNWRRRVFDKAVKKAEIKRITPHQLRHTYATLRIAKGDNIADVSKQLGHHSVKMTLDVYYHWIPGGKKAEVDALDDPKLTIQTAPYLHPTTKIGHKKRA